MPHYPPVPEFTTYPGQQHNHHHGGDYNPQTAHRGPPPPPPPEGPHVGMGPAPVYVAPPKIEMQPWARNVWRWLAKNTSGVARVDLRRPTAPLPEQYHGNLLFVRSRNDPAAAAAAAGGGGRRRQRKDPAAPPPQYVSPLYGEAVAGGYPGAGQGLHVVSVPPASKPFLTGARIKITRSFLIRAPPFRRRAARDGSSSGSSSSDDDERAADPSVAAAYAAARAAAIAASAPLPPPPPPRAARRSWWSDKPLLDVGVGFVLDMDAQQIQPVARIKIKDLLSIKAAPMGVLKICRSLPLGPVRLKVHYELPLAHAGRFWEPPARLMVRLDPAAGSGVHLTAGGIEFDEQVLRFGSAVTMRASAGLAFPRQLPIEEGDEHPFKLQVHRLSLKSLW